MEGLNPEQNEDVMLFYDHKSNFELVKEFTACVGPAQETYRGEYPILMARNKAHRNELVVANTDKSIQLVDVEKGEIATFK